MDRYTRRRELDMVLPAAVFVALFLFLRAANQTPDGLSYAVSVRAGLDMFHPHHMIYVPVSRVIHLSTGADPITATLWQNLFWTVVLAFAAWRLAGMILPGRVAPVVAAVALLVLRGVMIYSVRVETYLPALACLAAATVLAVRSTPDRPGRRWLLAAVLALAILYHQSNVLFVIPLLVLLIVRRRSPGFASGLRQAGFVLAGAAILVLAVYVVGYRIDGGGHGFWAYVLSYARAPIEAWGSFDYYSPRGASLLAVSQLRMILPVRDGAAQLGGVAMSAALVFLVGWHLDRLRRKAPFARLRLFGLVFLAVYLLFFLWWMPSDTDFFVATLLPLWLLGLILVADLPSALGSGPIFVATVLILATGNLYFTILPMHRDPGPGRVLALALDREAPPGAEMVTGYSVQQEMLYFTDRTRVHEGEGLARAVLAGEAPWPRAQDRGTTIVIEGPYLRGILDQEDAAFLPWLVDFDPEQGSSRTVKVLPAADGLVLGPERKPVASWSAVMTEIREFSRP